MDGSRSFDSYFASLNARLETIDKKIDALARTRGKSMEWIATLSEQIQSLDAFREEVRATFEPFVRKLDNLDETMRILRHATCDVARRIDRLEQEHDKHRAAS